MLLSSSAATCTPLLLTCPSSTEMEMQIQDTADDTTALTRIKIVQHSTLSKLFMEAIQEYNSTLVRHRERCANLLKQQILITDKTVNYEELQELLDREESAIFVDNIISESLEAQLSLDAAKARHEELSKIEKSIAEIKDVFVEIALLVEDQGSKLDSIEHHVNKAMGNSVHGTKKLEKAKKRKRKHKRMQMEFGKGVVNWRACFAVE
uniref:t-SNARE coiled-coil homology domain-containing protein n=1 Tax=Timema poppense TaxID=170557 RepID=A0A7R9D2N5_TIMPO|nr:unnamed protein product [Timema poppensis]